MRVCITLLLIASITNMPVYGVFAQEHTQILNKLQLIAIQAQEAKMYLDMLKNSGKFDMLPWGNIQHRLEQFDKALRWGRSIAVIMSNADGEFRRRFPGYGRLGIPYADAYRDWNQTAMDTIGAVLAAAGKDRELVASDVNVIQGLREKAMDAEGRMQVLQAQASLAGHTAHQLIMLRDLMRADIASKQAFQAHQLQREATGEAAAAAFFNHVTQPDKGNRGFALK